MKNQDSILAYGFDAFGFQIPSASLDLGEGRKLIYVSCHTDRNLADSDGVIMPSGLFESEHNPKSYMSRRSFIADEHHLAVREKQIFQLFEKNGWVAFLVGEIENGSSYEWSRTDLAKRVLNDAFGLVVNHDPNPHITCKVDEFRAYLDSYGINRTTFTKPKTNARLKVIATNGGVVAGQVFGRVFFLPLPHLKGNSQELERAVQMCAIAVSAYRERNEIFLPGWVAALKFQAEVTLQHEEEAIERRLLEIREQRRELERHKAILSASGEQLRQQVLDVLREYFGLNVTGDDNNVEDAVIRDGEHALYVVEVKGVRGGLKREHLNQIDSHRERLSLTADTAGLLIVNDFMEIEGLEQRSAKQFDAQHLKHAVDLNIRILRTTTLFELMLDIEHLQIQERAGRFLSACSEAQPLLKHPAKKEGNG
jgi:hypothetical protein